MKIESKIKIVILGLLLTLPGITYSQVYTTLANGNWNGGTAVWANNGTPTATAPTSANSTSITISHAITITAGPITIDQATITTGGSITVNSSITLNIANGTGTDLAVSAGSFTNNGTITLALNASFTVASGVTVVNNNAFNLNASTTVGNTSVVTGSFQNSGSITSTASNLNFVSSSTYDHKFTTSQGSIPTATWSVGSTCQISGYTSSGPPSGGLSQSFSNFTWNCTNQSSLNNVNLSGAPTNVGGNFTVSSTGAGSLYAMSQSSGTNLTVSGNFVVSGTSQVNLTGTGTGGILTIGGSLTHSSSAAMNAATGAGSVDIRVAGNFTNSGAFNASTSNLSMLSAGSQSITGTVSLNNITIGNATSVSNNATLSMSGTLSLLGTGDSFNADGSGSGSLRLLSTSDSPANDASIAAIPTGATFSGNNVTVERYMAATIGNRLYRYLSSPIMTAKISDWQDDFSITGDFTGRSTTDPSNNNSTVCGVTIVPWNPSMYYYNPMSPVQDYVAYPTNPDGGVNAPLDPKKGYTAQIRNCSTAVVIDVTGPINKGDQVFTLQYNSPDAYTSNLIGNPYPSAIDWGTIDLSAATDVSLVVAVPDNTAGNTSYTYHTFDNSSGPGSYIATGQAFWAFALGSTTNQFTMTEDSKAPFGSAIFYRTASTKNDKLTIAVSNGSFTDKAFVRLQDKAKSSFERYDGPKLDNALFSISTWSTDNISLAVNSMNSISCGSIININSKNLTPGNYTFSAIPEGQLGMYDFTLNDSYKGTSTLLASQPYTFAVDANAASKSVSRFQIVVSEKKYSLKLAVTPQVKICGTDALVSVGNGEKSIQYVAQLNGVTVSDTIAGDGGNLNFKILASKLGVGNNTVTIKAIGGCSSAQLEQSSLIIKDDLMYTATQLSSATSCPGPVTLTVNGAPNGGSYNWYSSNANDAIPLSGQSGAAYVTPSLIPSTATYYVSVVNSVGCVGPKTAITTKITTTFNPSDLASSIACNKGTVTLTANGAPAGGRYNWYGPADTAPIAGQTTATFVTPSLQNTTTYYVSIVNSSGCEGAKMAVNAKISNYQEATITHQDDNTLKSNHTVGNQWYSDNVLLPDTTSVLKIMAIGVYTLEVRIGECVTSANQRIDAITGLGETSEFVKGYPNPVQSIYSLELPSEGIMSGHLLIYNSIGIHIGTMPLVNHGIVVKGEYDFSPHTPGLYLIRVNKEKDSFNMKVIKK